MSASNNNNNKEGQNAAYSSIYTTVKSNINDINKNQPESIFRNVEAKQSDVFMPSTMTKLTNKKEEKLTGEEINRIKEGGIKICLINSSAVTPTGGKTLLLKRRFAMLEKWLTGMRDPVDGVNFSDRRKMFDVNPSCCAGYEIVEWIFKHCKCQYRIDAKQIAQMMIDHGYLCPLELQNFTLNEDPDALYTFQAEFFYPSRFWKVANLDYAIHLVRRSSKNGGPLMLNKDEIERYYEIQKHFGSEWKNVVLGSERQKIYFHSLEKKDKRLLEYREIAFWHAHKPFKCVSASLEAHEMEEELGKKQKRESEYEASLTDQKLLAFLTKKLLSLQAQVSMYRKDSLSSCKTIIKFCEAWLPVDPILITRQSGNPWLRGELEEWPVDTSTVPKQERVHLWTTSFRDMIADPLGLQYFTKFMEKDLAVENLDFYLECLELEKIQDRSAYFEKCFLIFKRFIRNNSPNEINIDSTMRKAIVDKIEKSSFETLDINVFDHAVEHVYQLMFKDRFPKFNQSEEIKSLLEGYQPRRKPTFANIETSDTQSSTSSSKTDKGMFKAKTMDLDAEIDRKMIKNVSSDRFIRKSNTAELGQGKVLIKSASQASDDQSQKGSNSSIAIANAAAPNQTQSGASFNIKNRTIVENDD